MTDDPVDREPEDVVGYGRPPRHSQFKPGQSGNRRGRPKQRRKVEDFVHDVLHQKTWISLGGKRKRVTAVEAILYRLLEQSLKGDIKAARLLIEMKASRPDTEDHSTASLLLDEDLAILASAGIALDKGTPDVGA